MRDNAHLGADGVAALLDRSTSAVRQQARTHHISLRRTGETRGLLIGQPRGIKLSDLPELLAATGDTDIDLADVIARVQAASTTTQPICPHCTERPANHQASGWCVTCYLKQLAAAHRAAKSETAAGREYAAAKQERKRGGRSTPRKPAAAVDELEGPSWA